VMMLPPTPRSVLVAGLGQLAIDDGAGAHEAAIGYEDGKVGAPIRRVTMGPHCLKSLSRNGSTWAAEWRNHIRLLNSGTATGPA
jgi:hypothetical protein